MYWGIYDNYTVRYYEPKGEAPVLIRVLEPGYKKTGIPYTIKHIDKYVNVLEVYFDDISDMPEGYEAKYMLFNEDNANEILHFINNNDYDEVVVHCNAGVSRSSAVMIGIAKALGREDIVKEIYDSNCYLPNTKVLKTFDRVIKETPMKFRNRITKDKGGNTNYLPDKERKKIDRILSNMLVVESVTSGV